MTTMDDPAGGSVALSASEIAAVREMLDKQQIADLILLRARAGDHADEDTSLACYSPGATEHHGAFEGPAERFIRTVSRRSQADPSRRSTWTAVMPPLIDIDGDCAYAESHAVMFVELDEAGEAVDLQNGLRYLDRLERRSGRWLIAHRDVVYDWSRVEPATRRIWDKGGAGQYLRGERGPGDVVYSRLLAQRPGRE